MSFTIDTAPAAAAADQLAGVGDRLGDTTAVLRATALEITRLAAPATPRATGRLAASVSVAGDPTQATVRWGVPYAVFVNFGTRRMRARPFATDALAAAEPVLEQLADQWATDLVGAS